MRRLAVATVAFLTAAALPATAQAALPPLPTVELPAVQLPNLQQEADRFLNTLPPEWGSSRPAPAAQPAQQPAQPAQSAAKTAPNCANCVAITYDDGPSPLTNQLLDTLKSKNTHASFMVLAPNATAHPKLLRRMQAEGHTIGNHTNTHRELNKLAAGDVDGEIKAGASAIKAATGQNPRWLRPPYGATNGTVDAAAKANGQAEAMWSVDTLDWKDRNSEHVCSTAVSGAQPGGIILMHDIHATTVNAASCVIDGLRAKGLEPVSLDTLIPNPQPGKQYYSRS